MEVTFQEDLDMYTARIANQTGIYAQNHMQIDKGHPMLQDKPWFVDFLECSACRTAYTQLEVLIDMYFPKTSAHNLMDGKVAKGAMHFICVMFYSGKTCMRYLQTYVDLTTSHIFRGVLDVEFFCGPILHMCESISYNRTTLQFY